MINNIANITPPKKSFILSDLPTGSVFIFEQHSLYDDNELFMLTDQGRHPTYTIIKLTEGILVDYDAKTPIIPCMVDSIRFKEIHNLVL